VAIDRVIVMGASAGGIEALSTVVGGLQPDIPAAVLVVMHVAARSPNLLPGILGRAGPLPAATARDGEPVERGRIYVAAPDCHLLLHGERVRVVTGPKENWHRPAIDPLFRSAAQSWRSRAIGVVLSGALDDGTAGLFAIRRRGGIAVVQDPADALCGSMPQSALRSVGADHVAPAARIGALLDALARIGWAAPSPVAPEPDADLAANGGDPLEERDMAGRPSVYSCPECHGTLWEIHEDTIVRFRCRTGHGYSAETLSAHQDEVLEAALWTALRVLEENVSMSRRLEQRARADGHERSADHFRQRVESLEEKIATVRRALRPDAEDGDPG
jgi:two-component system chemotaxis response regulator CheB